MPELPSILLQRGIASEREVAEAVARSELHGGHLVTSLLQFAEVQEADVLEAVAECYGLPSVAPGVLPQPDHRAFIRIPREVAERYCVAPLSSIGSVLVVAVCEPLERGVEEELGYALGIELRQQVALEVRIRQAIARDYQAPLAPRHQRGIARLESDFENAPEETPLGSWPVSRLSRLPRPPSEPPRPRAQPPSATPPPARVKPSHKPRSRGPITLASARQRLIKERSRDGVLAAYFGFVSQYFEYAALFAVHSALAEGLDASGPGASSQTVRTIGVPLDLPSSMATAVESGEPLLGPLPQEGLDQTFAQDLERSTREAVLLLPIRLRSRCVLLLYADNGSAPVRASDLGDVLSLSNDVGHALERLILERKRSLKLPQATAPKASSIASFPPPTIEADSDYEGTSQQLSHYEPTAFEPNTPVESVPREPEPAQHHEPAPAPRQPEPTQQREPAPALSEPAPAPRQPAPTQQEPASSEPAAAQQSLPAQRMVSIEPPAAPAAPIAEDVGKPLNEPGEKPFLLDRSRSTKPPEVAPSSPPQTSISYPSPQRITQRLPSVIVSENAEQPTAEAGSARESSERKWHPEPLASVPRPRAPFPPALDSEQQPERSAAKQGQLRAERLQLDAEQRQLNGEQSPPSSKPDRPSLEQAEPDAEHGPADAKQAPPESTSIDGLVQEALSGSATAALELASNGQESSLSALLKHFPGPVISERAGPNSKASECGPLLQALANIGAPATVDVSRFSQDPDDNVRRWATLLLGELPSPEACRAVAERLGDPAPRVRQAATDAARLLLKTNAANLFRKTLFEMASSSETQDHLRLRALEHIARLQDNASVPRLVQMLKETRGTMAHKVMWALTVITRQDFGRDVERWTVWWQEHQSQHRVQWLIDALTHSDLRLRRAAWEELRRETGSDYDYDATADVEKRVAAQQRYRDWWKSTGARRFGRLC